MMDNMMQMAGNIQVQKSEEKDKYINEQNERIMRQEGRMDTAYDKALDYATRTQVAKAVCKACGNTLEPNAAFCDNCGLKTN